MSVEFDGTIGIDLGTTYSCVAVFVHDHVEVIPNDQGNRTTPSCVAFYNDEILVGDSAKNLVTRGVSNVIYDAKRMIGHRFSDKVIQDDLKRWPFALQCGENDKIEIEVEFRGEVLRLAPEQISAYVLSYLKTCAEKFLAKSVHNAVITVPAYFNDAQRERTKAAATIAGLNAIRIVNEPTAAALCYGLGVTSSTVPSPSKSTQLFESSVTSSNDASDEHNTIIAKGQDGSDVKYNNNSSNSGGSTNIPELRNIVVFDLGGGTFDVSVITVDEGSFAVRSTAGDTHLGGQDVDSNLLEYVMHDVSKRFAIDLRALPRQMAKARAACERVKRTLSHTTSDEIILESLLPNGEDYVLPLSRAKLEELNSKLFDKCVSVVKRALHDATLSTAEIHAVILVGGSSRIPRLHTLLAHVFTADKLCSSVHPDEAVAIGAAIQASILSSSPAQQSTKTSHVVLMDVVPLSIGVEIDDGKLDVIISRNTTIPYRATKEYSTVQDNQEDVDIVVFEGERSQTRYCHKLGEFALEGITRAKRGDPTITVTFSIDADGLLTITASEELAHKTKSLTVQNTERLSEEEVRKMIGEAERLRKVEKTFMTVESAETVLESALSELQHIVDQDNHYKNADGSVINNNNEREEKNNTPLLTDDKREVCEKLMNHVREWMKRRLPSYNNINKKDKITANELNEKVQKILKRLHQATKLATRTSHKGMTGSIKTSRSHDKPQRVARSKTEHAMTAEESGSSVRISAEENKENHSADTLNISNAGARESESQHAIKKENITTLNNFSEANSNNDYTDNENVSGNDLTNQNDNNNDECHSNMSDLMSDGDENAEQKITSETEDFVECGQNIDFY